MPGPGIIVTPGTILDYMREVDRYIDAIQAAVVSQADKVPTPTLAAWARFVSDWKIFLGTHQDFTDRLSGSVADTAERYERDATAWRGVLGGFISTANIVFDASKRPPGPSLPTIGETTDLVKWGAIGLFAYWLLLRGRR